MILSTLSLFVISITVSAQKLSNIQKTAVRTPSEVKIDGKATEWNNQFQAYNHATELFYTIANNDDKLYLIVKAEQPDVIFKIINAGGIALNISKSKQDDDKKNAIITFPVYDGKDRAYINVKNKPLIKQGSATSIVQADSFMNVNNKKLSTKAKYIKITGIPELDTLTSVYNEKGIKAAALFDNNMVYTYELAIPLKYLGLSVNNPTKFYYHLILRGLTPQDIGIAPSTSHDGKITINIPPGAVIPTKDQFSVLSATTDFWGEYTLAKGN